MALLRLLYDTGMRRGECANLKVEDIDWERDVVTVFGKGRRIRACPFGKQAATALDRYLRLRARHAHGDEPWLWLGKRGRLLDSAILQVVRRRSREAGLGKLHPHLFRHVLSISEPRLTVSTPGPRILYPTWVSWPGGVVLNPAERLLEDDDQPLAGVLAGALGVSEAFQATRGLAVAGRRTIGISLWRPDVPWRAPDAVGPSLEVLPEKMWLLGLGHLGQAFAWSRAIDVAGEAGHLRSA